KGWTVTANEILPKVMGLVESVDVDTRTITLQAPAQNLIPEKTIYSIILRSPVDDPYATKLRSVWYSWAKYYVGLFSSTADQDVTATVREDTDSKTEVKDTRILEFSTDPTTLAVGMRLTKVNGVDITPLITILKIDHTNKKVYLSQPIPNVTAGQSVTATFAKPAAIDTFGDTFTTFDIDDTKFDTYPNGTPITLADVKQFAGNVYESLSVFSTIIPRKVPLLPGSLELIGNSIGGNVGFLPTANYGPENARVALQNISANVRDILKSALRGIPDFADTARFPEATWYPDPAKAAGGQTFNVMNIDPFGWFVHVTAGRTGYGFSFDDDTADVGANQANALAIAFGGLTGLTNKSQWGPNTYWGPKSATGTIVEDGAFPGKKILQLDNTPANLIV